MSAPTELEQAVAALKREDRRGDAARDLVDLVDNVAPEAGTPAELLGLTIGRAYGVAIYERDQARMVADGLAVKLAAAMDHVRTLLTLAPASSFATANDDMAKAQAWLDDLVEAGTVESPQTPEQEGQP